MATKSKTVNPLTAFVNAVVKAFYRITTTKAVLTKTDDNQLAISYPIWSTKENTFVMSEPVFANIADIKSGKPFDLVRSGDTRKLAFKGQVSDNTIDLFPYEVVPLAPAFDEVSGKMITGNNYQLKTNKAGAPFWTVQIDRNNTLAFIE